MNRRMRSHTWLVALIILIAGMSVVGVSSHVAADDAASQLSPDPRVAVSVDAHMKTIGIIGGISWVSSIEYYRLINERVRDQLGGVSSAKLLMYSIPFSEFAREERRAADGDWAPLEATMLDAAQRLQRAGADFIVIASNTMNSSAELIEAKLNIPVLHIADATGRKVKAQGISKVALLGTAYTMGQAFYRDRLERHGLEVVVPNEAERQDINAVIFDELCAGRFRDDSRARFVEIIERLVKEEGAQGVILGCTEIPLLIKQSDVSVPVFDTTAIHSEAAVRHALGLDE